MERKQFTFYRSIYSSAEDIPEPLERLALYEAVIEFGLFEKEPEGLSPWVSSVFKSIRPNLEASILKAKMGAKSKRGPGKKSKNNESEKENENEVENEIEKENEIEDECLSGVGFEEFWKKYPVKVGKQKAGQVWKTSVKEPEAVLEGLEKWIRSPQWCRENGRFVPRAVKFLEDEDWRADPPGYVPMGGTGKLGEAELQAIAQMLEEG